MEGYPGRFSGTETHSQVRLRTSWRDDGTYIECEAFNPKLGAPTLNDRIQLNVTFAPKFSALGDFAAGDFASKAVQEGTNVTLKMGVVANPKPADFTWLFGNRPFEGNHRVVPIRGKLVLKNVNRRDAGNYTLMVANKQGRSSLKFFLNVTCELWELFTSMFEPGISRVACKLTSPGAMLYSHSQLILCLTNPGGSDF